VAALRVVLSEEEVFLLGGAPGGGARALQRPPPSHPRPNALADFARLFSGSLVSRRSASRRDPRLPPGKESRERGGRSYASLVGTKRCS